jgi:hypothetical protein
MRDFYNANYKTLQKDIEEDTKRWKDLPCSWTGRILLRCPYYPKQSAGAIPIKILIAFFIEPKKTILNFIWKHK